jgi:hypothetical protein
MSLFPMLLSINHYSRSIEAAAMGSGSNPMMPGLLEPWLQGWTKVVAR